MSLITIETTKGTIKIELDADKAPITVENFLSYVNDGFFDNTIFHRVIPNFMIQGGGFESGMNQKETKAQIKIEADNGLGNDRGTVAMARTNDPNSASSQFFINLKDNGFLNHTSPTDQGWGYCVFGKVTDGMDVVDDMATVSTGNTGGHGDVPTEDIIMTKVTVS